MKPFFLIFAFLLLTIDFSFAQTTASPADTSWKVVYRATPEKTFNLIHTKLQVKFDVAKTHMYGQAWITLQPHFYEKKTVSLDAKGMEIKEVSLIEKAGKSKLTYTYNGENLRIDLKKPCKKNDKITVYVDYIAKPNERKSNGSAAITDAKGLY